MVGDLSILVTVMESSSNTLKFLQVASVVIRNGGEVVLEWPRDASCWLLPEVKRLKISSIYAKYRLMAVRSGSYLCRVYLMMRLGRS